MPYTLAKALMWLALALALGITVGWLLRSVAAHRQIARVRSQRADGAELERLQARVNELEGALAQRNGTATPAGADSRTGSPAGTTPVVSQSVGDAATAGEPIDEASEILGHPVERDDLKVIEGIGPSVEDLCVGIGIQRWADMAKTEPSLLRTMLDDAGARFKMCDPTTWPRQAALLDAGRWDEFRELVDGMRDATRT